MKGIMISTLIAVALVVGVALITPRNSKINDDVTTAVNNVTILDGKQIINFRAKGGYQPRQSVAKAGIPTILRFNTSGTFDCSSSVRIPSLDISKFLPQSGVTDIDIGVPSAGLFKGTCGMGMYPFEIDFQN